MALAIHVVATGFICLARAHNCLIAPSLHPVAKLSHTWIGQSGFCWALSVFPWGRSWHGPDWRLGAMLQWKAVPPWDLSFQLPLAGFCKSSARCKDFGQYATTRVYDSSLWELSYFAID
jgi:hypothetical protein